MLTTWLSLHGVFALFSLLVYVLMSHTLHQRRHPSAAIGWVLLLGLLPYLGLPLYLLFGTRKLTRQRAAPGVQTMPHVNTLAALAAALGQPPSVGYAALVVHADGAAARSALWATIDHATHSLDVSTFILGRDGLGDAVVARLIARARAGVRVRLLLDGMGRYLGGHIDLAALRAGGVQVRLFVPPLHSPLRGRTNLRNHRKLVIADDRFLWCGGRNLAAEYFVGDADKPAWHDLSFDLSGTLAQQASALFAHDWAFAGDEPRPAAFEIHQPELSSGAQLIASGPDQRDDTVYALLISACYRAEQRILMITPYFVPDDALLIALALAARRGVAVELLLPAHSNHRLADLARHRALRTLVEAGAMVRQVPHMLHAKLIIVDADWALAGSANLDSRSLFLNYELMVAFHAPDAVAAFADWYQHEARYAQAYVSHPPGLWRDLGEGLVLWLAFQL